MDGDHPGKETDNYIQCGLRCMDFVVGRVPCHRLCVDFVNRNQPKKHVPLARFHYVITLWAVADFVDVGGTTDHEQNPIRREVVGFGVQR